MRFVPRNWYTVKSDQRVYDYNIDGDWRHYIKYVREYFFRVDINKMPISRYSPKSRGGVQKRSRRSNRRRSKTSRQRSKSSLRRRYRGRHSPTYRGFEIAVGASVGVVLAAVAMRMFRQGRQGPQMSKLAISKENTPIDMQRLYNNAHLIVSAQVSEKILVEGKKFKKRQFVWCPFNFYNFEMGAWNLVDKQPRSEWPDEWIGVLTTKVNVNFVGEYFNELSDTWPRINRLTESTYTSGTKKVDSFTLKQLERLVVYGTFIKNNRYRKVVESMLNPKPQFDRIGMFIGSNKYVFTTDHVPVLELFNHLGKKKYDIQSLMQDDNTYTYWENVLGPDDDNWIEADDIEGRRKVEDINFVKEKGSVPLTPPEIIEIVKKKRNDSTVGRIEVFKFTATITFRDYVEVSHGDETVYLVPSQKSGGNVRFRIDNAMKSMFAKFDGVYTDGMAALYIAAKDYGLLATPPLEGKSWKKEQDYESPFPPTVRDEKITTKFDDNGNPKKENGNQIYVGWKSEYNYPYVIIPRLKDALSTNGKLQKELFVISDYEMDDIIMLRFLSRFYEKVYVQLIEDGRDNSKGSALVNLVREVLTEDLPSNVVLLPNFVSGKVNLDQIKNHFVGTGAFFEAPWHNITNIATKLLTPN